LKRRRYKTVRGESAISLYDIGKRVDVIVNGKVIHRAMVMKLEHKKFSEMSLEFLKLDAEYEGFKINKRSDFIELVNTFRRRENLIEITSADPTFTVIHLRRIVLKKQSKKITVKKWLMVKKK
jgi:predicted SPOUT superfamily RNA methylase MTH1